MTERKDENLERLDKALEGLGRTDAPERLVQETLESVRNSQITEHVPNRYRDQRWASGIAAAVVVVSALGIVFQEFGSYQDLMSLQPSETPRFSTPPVKACQRQTKISACAGLSPLKEALAAAALWTLNSSTMSSSVMRVIC